MNQSPVQNHEELGLITVDRTHWGFNGVYFKRKVRVEVAMPPFEKPFVCLVYHPRSSIYL